VTLLISWQQRGRELKRDTYALYLACRDARTPWYAKALAAAVVAYAFSPIDLIPDFIPVLGYLDDLVLIPLGLVLATRLVPAPVIADCRERAAAQAERPTSRGVVFVIIAIWILLAALAVSLILNALGLR
jgi:uncharacterized membrane protein YkvA (DUF1232 family)